MTLSPEHTRGNDSPDHRDESRRCSACLCTNKSQPAGTIRREYLAVRASKQPTAHPTFRVFEQRQKFIARHCLKVVNIQIALVAVEGFAVALHVFPACATGRRDEEIAQHVEADGGGASVEAGCGHRNSEYTRTLPIRLLVCGRVHAECTAVTLALRTGGRALSADLENRRWFRDLAHHWAENRICCLCRSVRRLFLLERSVSWKTRPALSRFTACSRA